jgi:tetratricopeptide (TPR) repeat protein
MQPSPNMMLILIAAVGLLPAGGWTAVSPATRGNTRTAVLAAAEAAGNSAEPVAQPDGDSGAVESAAEGVSDPAGSSAAPSGPLNASALLNKNEAMQHFQQGKNLLQRRLYQGAIVEFQKALALDPGWQDAKMALMWAKRDWKLSQEANAQHAPSLPEMVQKGQTFYERGRRLEAENNLVEAALAYKDALNAVGDYPEARTALARVQAKAQVHLSEVKGKTNLEPVRPKAADVHSMLEPAPARRRLPKAIVRSQNIRTGRHLQTSLPAPAGENKVSQAIQTHYLNGNQALDCGDYAGAIQEFELILEFVPDHKKALYKLAQAKQKRREELETAQRQVQEATASGDTVGKLKALRDMAVIDPTNAKIQENWAKARQENPEMAEKLYRRGVELYAQGRYQEALQNWELVLDMNPQHKKSLESSKAVREKLLLISNQKQ